MFTVSKKTLWNIEKDWSLCWKKFVINLTLYPASWASCARIIDSSEFAWRNSHTALKLKKIFIKNAAFFDIFIVNFWSFGHQVIKINDFYLDFESNSLISRKKTIQKNPQLGMRVPGGVKFRNWNYRKISSYVTCKSNYIREHYLA